MLNFCLGINRLACVVIIIGFIILELPNKNINTILNYISDIKSELVLQTLLFGQLVPETLINIRKPFHLKPFAKNIWIIPCVGLSKNTVSLRNHKL